jgi:hypothetical protein
VLERLLKREVRPLLVRTSTSLVSLCVIRSCGLSSTLPTYAIATAGESRSMAPRRATNREKDWGKLDLGSFGMRRVAGASSRSAGSPAWRPPLQDRIVSCALLLKILCPTLYSME